MSPAKDHKVKVLPEELLEAINFVCAGGTVYRAIGMVDRAVGIVDGAVGTVDGAVSCVGCATTRLGLTGHTLLEVFLKVLKEVYVILGFASQHRSWSCEVQESFIWVCSLSGIIFFYQSLMNMFTNIKEAFVYLNGQH